MPAVTDTEGAEKTLEELYRHPREQTQLGESHRQGRGQRAESRGQQCTDCMVCEGADAAELLAALPRCSSPVYHRSRETRCKIRRGVDAF